MATKLPTTFFLSNGWRGLNGNTNSRFQQKKQQGKNVSPGPLPISERFQQSDDESAEIKMAPVDIISHSDLEMSPNSDESTEVQNDKEDCIPSLNKESTSNNESDITFTDQNNSLGYLDSSTSSREQNEPSGEINTLEMRLAETDARIQVAAQEKIHMKLLEDQLENLKNELKKELSNFKGADERLLAVENERSTLDAALKDLESRLAATQKNVLKISTLEFECKDLRDKIGYLQGLLDKTTKQADHELQKKVDRLEESLQEADLCRLSSEKMQQYNELMQQKMQILQESLDKSDQEIQSHIQLYQESVLKFQDVFGSLKEDSKSKPSYEPVEDLPWVFWSWLLLIVDGWLLENKISFNDAKLLREMAWKRDRRICEAYLACKDKNESEVVATFMKFIPSSPTSLGLHIIHIAAEMAPVAKVGGLGDVVSGLSKALQKKGHLVEVVLPKYDCIQCDRVGDMRALDMVLESFFDGQLYKNKVWIVTVEGLPVYFIEPLHPSNFFSRGQFYREHDDFKCFSYFSRAALELLLQAGKKPDIIHCHDWKTPFVASLYWDLYAPKGLNSARVVFTCHNFEYQGTANASELASCGLDVHRLNRPDRMQDRSARDRINPVKGAVVYSNIVTTVSPTYAQEVWTSQYSSTRKTSSLMARFSLTLLLLLSFMCFSSAKEDTRGREKISSWIDDTIKISSWIDDTTTASLPDGSMVLHGYLCIISYGIMIPLVAFFGRHRRFFSAEHDGLVWKIFHIGFSLLTMLIVVLDWILIRSIVSFTSLHSWLAIFISILGAIQILFVRNRRLHKIVGTLILVACILNSFEGIYLMQVTSVRGVFMFFIILISIFSIIMDYLPTTWSNNHIVHVHVE